MKEIIYMVNELGQVILQEVWTKMVAEEQDLSLEVSTE